MQRPELSFASARNQTAMHFGALLKTLRHRQSIRQLQVLAHLPGWTQTTYSRVENGEVAPAFDQLAPLYYALHQAGVRLTPLDRQHFLTLARLRIEAKKTYRERKTDVQWEELRLLLSQTEHEMSKDDRAVVLHGRTQSRPRLVETRHLVGREDWLASVLASLHETLPKKLIVLQGPVGIGKSSELHRIAQHFLHADDTPHTQIILCELPFGEGSGGPESALDLFLGTLLAEVGPPDAALQTAVLARRITFVLDCLEKITSPFLLLLDNAEQMLDEQGHIASCWQQFLKQFLRSQHHASLVLATTTWPGWFGGERVFLIERMVPPLSAEAGALLLQQLGLADVPKDYLRSVSERVGGIPLCLEWVASLAQEPMLRDEWDGDEIENDEEEDAGGEHALTRRLQRIVEDASLFEGPIAGKLLPLLDRIIEKHLSAEAYQVLCTLALATLPLGKPALQRVCPRPRLLKELSTASLLVAYTHRVQLLPMVASAIRARLSEEQRYALEETVMDAYQHWLDEGKASDDELGAIIAELATLYLKHARLLDATELLTHHGWLSFNKGYGPRLAILAQNVMKNVDWRTSAEQQCGGILLQDVLAPFLGKTADEKKRLEDFQRILDMSLGGKVALQPTTEMHLIRHLMLYHMNSLCFEDAQAILEAGTIRLESHQDVQVDTRASLLAQRAWLLTRWSEHLEEQRMLDMVQAMREQTIVLYRQCCTLLSASREVSPLNSRLFKKRLCAYFNSLGYQLNRDGQFKEALEVLKQSATLAEQGYCNFGALAAIYGDISQALIGLGCFREAVLFDEKAFADVQRSIDVGYALARREIWIYLVNRGRLYLRLGRVEEAEQLLQETLPHIHPKRRVYRMFAQETLDEIKHWRLTTLSTQHQLDWRWIERYRTLSAYDSYWWWAQAGPFTEEEQHRWDQLSSHEANETTKEQLGHLLTQTRQRELKEAFSQQREPRLSYPALDIAEVRRHITALLELDTEIRQQEPNAIIRRLYQGVLEDELCYLRMIEATYEGNITRFRAMNQHLFSEPTAEEMTYALARLRRMIQQGFEHPKTEEISQKLMQFLTEHLHLSVDISIGKEDPPAVLEQSSSGTRPTISPQAAKRFYEAILHASGYEEWQVLIDANEGGNRVESGLRQLFIQNTPVTVDRIRHLVAHELAGHVARSTAGEHSLIGLLGIGTQGYSATEEGLALYQERQATRLYGQPFSDLPLWTGTLAIGLVCGVATPPQTFLSLYSFFEIFSLLHRRLWKPREDVHIAQERAQKVASSRCLRTFRGVPNLECAGVCLQSDVVYLRGLWKIERAVAEDETVLDRLAVGKVSYELLWMLQELELPSPPQPLRQLICDPELDAYILSFEQAERKPDV